MNSRNITLNGLQIDDYLTAIRLGAQDNKNQVEKRKQRIDEEETDQEPQPVRRKLDFEDETQTAQQKQPELTMREKAHNRMLEAEKYQVQIEKPKGMEIFHNLDLNRTEFSGQSWS